MKHLLLAIFFSSSVFAKGVFPIKKMVCSGHVTNAPDELSENYYYAGLVIIKDHDSLLALSCLGPSQSFVDEMIQTGRCGYSGKDKFSLLKYNKTKNKTYIYNDQRSLKLVLGYKMPNNIYNLSGRYDFWGRLAPEMYYQVDCKTKLMK